MYAVVDSAELAFGQDRISDLHEIVFQRYIQRNNTKNQYRKQFEGTRFFFVRALGGNNAFKTMDA